MWALIPDTGPSGNFGLLYILIQRVYIRIMALQIAIAYNSTASMGKNGPNLTESTGRRVFSLSITAESTYVYVPTKRAKNNLMWSDNCFKKL